jgi:ribosome-associated protein
MELIEINTESIKLDQFLKWAGIIETGGQVKEFIDEQLIELNGQLVTEKRKTLKNKDIINIIGLGTYQVVVANDEN